MDVTLKNKRYQSTWSRGCVDMSGIEVVGIVLGSIPLLISGLEHYAEGIRTIKNMWEYEAVIDHLITVFTLDQAIFRHSCQELLMPILSDTQAAELLDGASPQWENKDLDQRLQKRLGTDYSAYTRSVRMLTRKMKLFVRKLGLDEKTMLVSGTPMLGMVYLLKIDSAPLDLEVQGSRQGRAPALLPSQLAEDQDRLRYPSSDQFGRGHAEDHQSDRPVHNIKYFVCTETYRN